MQTQLSCIVYIGTIVTPRHWYDRHVGLLFWSNIKIYFGRIGLLADLWTTVAFVVMQRLNVPHCKEYCKLPLSSCAAAVQAMKHIFHHCPIVPSQVSGESNTHRLQARPSRENTRPCFRPSFDLKLIMLGLIWRHSNASWFDIDLEKQVKWIVRRKRFVFRLDNAGVALFNLFKTSLTNQCSMDFRKQLKVCQRRSSSADWIKMTQDSRKLILTAKYNGFSHKIVLEGGLHKTFRCDVSMPWSAVPTQWITIDAN